MTASVMFVGACGDDDTEAEAGAASTATSTTSAAPEETTKPLRLAFIGPLTTNYAQATLKAVEDVAKKNGGTAAGLESSLDAAKAFRVVEDATASGKYDGLIIFPISSAGVVPAAKAAIEKGLLVASTDFVLGPDLKTEEIQVPGQVIAVNTPTYTRGTHFGDAIIKACEGVDPCKVAWMKAIAGSPWDEAIVEAVEDRLKTAPSIELVSIQGGGNFNTPDALKVAQTAVQANPDLNVYVTTADQMTTGAQLAVDKAGLSDQVKLIGHGAGCIATKELKAGNWFASITATPYDEGRLAAEGLFAAAAGGPKEVVIDPVEEVGAPPVIYQENVDDFKCQSTG